MNDVVQSGRIQQLNDVDAKDGSCVLYVMSRDQRAHDNHALLAAQNHALKLQLPLIVFFQLFPKSGVRNKWQYEFMLKGLKEVRDELINFNIAFIMQAGYGSSVIEDVCVQLNPVVVYFDFSPLRRPQSIQSQVAGAFDIPVYVVDAHNIVPVWAASDKQEVGARTLRPKIHRLLDEFLIEPPRLQVHEYIYEDNRVESLGFDVALQHVYASEIDGYQPQFKSGSAEAQKILKLFIDTKLKTYHQDRNHPDRDGQSDMSPYLHFGQISALRIALEVEAYDGGEDDLHEAKVAYLEELIIRKELSDNFCYYTHGGYDDLSGAANWARDSLNKHADDEREWFYSRDELESAQTHDRAWNAAQTQLATSGKVHGYMRMYWAKKLLEWTASPEEALSIGIYLNDKYHLDGNDPNGYVGLLWSIAGVHDRGWTERDVFGKIRYMNYSGLKRKFNIQEYEDIWLGEENTKLL